MTDRKMELQLLHQYCSHHSCAMSTSDKTHHLDVIDGIVFSFLISCDFAVTAMDKIQADC